MTRWQMESTPAGIQSPESIRQPESPLAPPVPTYASSGYVSGLTNGTSATISLVEVNSKGNSAAATATATPVSQAPSVPTVGTITTSATSATVNFTIADQGNQPVWDGKNSHGIYFALYSSVANFYSGTPISGTANGQGSTCPITSVTFTGLTANTTYYFSLRAYNDTSSPTAMGSFTTTK